MHPQVAYSGIDTKVNLYLTAIEGAFTVTMWPDGDTSNPITLDATLAPGKTRVIQATIPEGTAASAAGSGYTLQVADESDCLAVLEDAVRVTDTLVVETGTVTPPFGLVEDSSAITINLGSSPGSTGTPRAFLNPAGAEPAIQLMSVTVVDDTTLTAVVPAGTPPGQYDLVIVWPDGNVAVLAGAYTSVTDAPPVIDDVVPQSIVNQAGAALEIRGSHFSGSVVSLRCQTDTGIVTVDATEQTEVCAAGSCTQQVTVDGSSLAPGDICVVRLANTDAGAETTFAEFSAIGITTSSFNLSAPIAGEPLTVGRRALVSAAVKASSAARFVYAIGGDTGAVADAMRSVEYAPIDIFGNMSPWLANTESMATSRAFAGTASLGRYVYVFGGNDGSGALASAERTLVLSPAEIPTITDVDLCLSGGSADCFGVAGLAEGLDAGVYSYRIAALIDSTDPVNLGGETLASDPLILRLRSVLERKSTVSLDWSAPVDAAGVELSGISGYRIYRTPLDGIPGTDEVLLAEVSAGTLSYIDDGGTPLGTRAPLRQGATSAWQALPNLAVPREGVAGAAAMDPAVPDTWYVYALLGRSGTTAHTTYEYLTVTEDPSNGRQTVGAAWTAGAEESFIGRWQHGAWTVDTVTSSFVTAGDTWVYLGAGVDGAGTAQEALVEAALVTTGGELTGAGGDFPDDPTSGDIVDDFSSTRAGYGTAAAAGSLFVFGGTQSGGGVAQNATAARFVGAPDLANNSWNNEGLSMTSPRTLMGSSIQSAFIFLVGGSSDGTNALTSTETVVW